MKHPYFHTRNQELITLFCLPQLIINQRHKHNVSKNVWTYLTNARDESLVVLQLHHVMPMRQHQTKTIKYNTITLRYADIFVCSKTDR